MSKLKLKKRRVPTKMKHVTCHYCTEFYHSQIRQTSGEFVTRQSKGKKVRVKGNTIFRFCPRARAFTSVNEHICSVDNFEPAPLFHCEKRNCWLATAITCYASKARKMPMVCIKCRQFDQIISNIIDKPTENIENRPSALDKPVTDPIKPIAKPKTRLKIKRREESKPVSLSIKRNKLKRRRGK